MVLSKKKRDFKKKGWMLLKTDLKEDQNHFIQFSGKLVMTFNHLT